jgi:hypothetical protein
VLAATAQNTSSRSDKTRIAIALREIRRLR